MDPITQGLLGAAAAQAVFSRQLGRYAVPIGMGAGMLADIDVLIRSSSDPLLGMMVHRGFTHSLAFIPVGGLLAALPFMLIKGLQYRRRAVLGAAVLAYATHAPLDALTSYGTLLFWPFSDMRVALDWMPIIDPIFTFALVLGVVLAAVKRRFQPARVGLMAAALYVMLGAVQHQRAMNVQLDLADSRFHEIERRRVMPTLGNIVVWRSIYQSRGIFYADQIRVPPVGEETYRPGEQLRAMNWDRWHKQVPRESRAARDVARFAWFSDQFIAPLPDDPHTLGDMRYSLATGRFEPLWVVRYDPQDVQKPVRVAYPSRDAGGRREAIATLWRDLWRPADGDQRASDIGVIQTPTRASP